MTNSSLKQIAQQIIALETQRDDLKADIAAAYDAAKHYGYNLKAVRQAIKVARMSAEKRADYNDVQASLLDYLAEIEGRQLREAAE